MNTITGLKQRIATIVGLFCAALLSGCLEEAPHATQMLPVAPVYREIPAAPQPAPQPALQNVEPKVAPVISAMPNYREVAASPRQECRMSAPPQARYDMGVVIGSMAGGIIGNQIGGGQGHNAAILVGAILGAITGKRLDIFGNSSRNTPSASSDAERCIKTGGILKRTQTKKAEQLATNQKP